MIKLTTLAKSQKYLLLIGLLSATGAVGACGDSDGRGQEDNASGASGISGSGLEGSPEESLEGMEGSENEESAEGSYDVGASDEEPGADSGPESGLGPCDAYDINVDVTLPNVLLVLDHSISMENNFNGDTRWAGLWDAVDYLTGNYDTGMNLGAMMFPDVTAGYNKCDTATVEVPVAPLNGANIMNVIPPRNHIPTGNTPTQAGLMVAGDHLETLDPEVPRAAILITDGDPRCQPGNGNIEATDTTVDDFAGTLFNDRGIPVYVIGMSLGSSASAILNELALKGGVPNTMGAQDFYVGNDLNQLKLAFDAISADVVSCEITLEESPADVEYFEVEVDGTLYGQVMDCDAEDGWMFVEGSMNGKIMLCGAACNNFKVTGEMTAVQECPPPG